MPGEADGTVGDATTRADDPAGRVLEVVGGEGTEVGHAKNEHDWLRSLRDLTPVVTVVLHLGVDLEGDVRERVRSQRRACLEDGERVQDVGAGRDELCEVVLLEVGDKSLDLLDGALLVAVEETVEGGEVVDELGICNLM